MAATLFAAVGEKHLVEDQPGEGRRSDRERKNEGGGLEAVEAAKTDGRWDAAYDSPKAAQIPEDFQAALNVRPRAREFFETLDSANRYAVLFRIQTVKKAETRARKIREFVEMLERKEKIHEPRTRKAKR